MTLVRCAESAGAEHGVLSGTFDALDVARPSAKPIATSTRTVHKRRGVFTSPVNHTRGPAAYRELSIWVKMTFIIRSHSWSSIGGNEA